MNIVCLTGNLVKDVELKKTTSGVSVVSGTIAVRRDYKNANGEYETDFIDFVCYRAQADYIAQYAHKGDRIELLGQWRNRKYQDSQGNNRQACDVAVNSISVMPKNAKPEEPTANITIEDDLPF